MLVPIVSVLNRDGKFTPRLLKQFWCSFNVSCSFGLQIFHPMMDHSIPVNIQAVVRILGFCKLSVLWSWWKIHSSFASGIFVLIDLSCSFGLLAVVTILGLCKFSSSMGQQIVFVEFRSGVNWACFCLIRIVVIAVHCQFLFHGGKFTPVNRGFELVKILWSFST